MKSSNAFIAFKGYNKKGHILESNTSRENHIIIIEKILNQITEHGVPEQELLDQLTMFKQGIPPMKLERPCTIDDGIFKLDNYNIEELLDLHNEAASLGKLLKFVPASGAASRMFKELLVLYNVQTSITLESLSILASQGDSCASFCCVFFNNIQNFAFFEKLKICMASNGKDIESIINYDDLHEVLEYLFEPKGLGYANLPKGLIGFHMYNDKVRTPIEEHIAEAIACTRNSIDTTKVHFTVQDKYRSKIESHIEKCLEEYTLNGYNVSYELSTQESSTDTIAVDLNNRPFYDKDKLPTYRPGGHGALLKNLNDLEADIVFIKNIDNVVPSQYSSEIYLYKKILCGCLIKAQKEIFKYLSLIGTGNFDKRQMTNIIRFLKSKLSISIPKKWSSYSLNEKSNWLFGKLNRPLRICGMVKNDGESGGGPFWVKNTDDSLSLQIVESAQIDQLSKNQSNIFNSSTHFNPVDIVCGLRDYKGLSFNLLDYLDPATAFITRKSKNGSEIKVMELPGLWNGSMALWNTMFVEVPNCTFNPVKTVNDLLEEVHQAEKTKVKKIV